jgi:hypothetical protein
MARMMSLLGAVVTAGVVLLAVARLARAEGLILSLQPGYQGLRTETWDTTGKKSTTRSDDLLELYSLGLEHSFFPNLRLSAGGLVADDYGWVRQAGESGTNDRLQLNYHANLILATPLLSTNLGFVHSEESDRFAGASRQSLASDTATLLTSYSPGALPSVALRLTHSHTYDGNRQREDLYNDDAQLLLGYVAGSALRLGDQVRVARTDDRVASLSTDLLANTFQATYNDSLLEHRMVLAAGVNGTLQTTWVNAATGAGFVRTQQYPVEGRSHVEQFGDLPTRDTLETNAALIDGNLDARTSLDLGWGVGDTNLRDIGVVMRDAVEHVSVIDLWVDRTLPPEVAAGLTFTAYTSNDDLEPKTWTQVDLAGAPQFGPLLNRFEVLIARTAAKYYKVVARPLLVGVTSNPAYEHIYVTEVQVFDSVPAAQAAGKRTTAGVTVNVSERTRLLEAHELYHDATLNLTRTVAPSAMTTWVFDTGLSYSRRLWRLLVVSTRLSRQEQDAGNGHASTTAATASLTARPLDPLLHSLTYSGQFRQAAGHSAWTQAINSFNRADLYTGIAVQLSGGLTSSTANTGQDQLGRQLSASLSLNPASALTLSGTYGYSVTDLSGGGQPTSRIGGDQFQGAVALNPFPAAYLSAGVTYTRPTNGNDRLLRVFGGSFSPFPDGTLQLRLAYTESYDNLDDSLSRLATAGLRWTLRAGISVDSSYSFVDTRGSLGRTRSHAVGASLTVAL